MEPIEIEAHGAKQGNNPMFGEWSKRFDFTPIPHGAQGDRRIAFQQHIRDELNTNFLFSNEIKVEIQLYLDEQNVFETDATADIDNFTKAILDGLKGPRGIMIDDVQVQALQVSWLDAADGNQSFEVRIKGGPDDYLMRGLEFFEMPDGLWYPVSSQTRQLGEAVVKSKLDRFFGICALEVMTDHTKKLRAILRGTGYTRIEAFYRAQHSRTPARGFHRSRLDEEFKLFSKREWRSELKEWSETSSSRFAELRSHLDTLRASLQALRNAYGAGGKG